MSGIYKGPLTLLILCALGALGILGPFSTDMYLPAFPLIAADLHTTASQVQLTLTAFTIGMAVGQLVLGSLSDKYGRRRFLIGGTVLMALSAAFSAVAPSITVLVLSCLMMGLSASAGLVVGRAVASDLVAGSQATKTFAVLGIVAGIGPILGPIGGSVVMGLFESWRGIFWLLSLIALLFAVAVIAIVPETHAYENRHSGGLSAMLGTASKVLRNRNYLFYSMTLWFGFALMFGYISASPFIVQSVLGLNAAQYTLIFGVNGLGLMACGLLTTRLARTWKPNRIIQIGVTAQLVAGTALVICAVSGTATVWTLLPIMFVMASSMGFVFGPATALALSQVRESSGTALAMSGAIQFICAGIAAPLVGIAGSAALFPFGLVTLVCALLAATGLWRGNSVAKRASTGASR